MAYEDQQARSSRVVVETPTSRREVTQTQALRDPERRGVSTATVGVIVVGAVALITILVVLLLNRQASETNNANLAAQQQPAPVPQTTIVQQPAPQQPVIIQQPAPVTQPAPIIVNPPATSGGSSVDSDAALQAAIDKKIADDPSYSTMNITAMVLNGKVTLIGTVKNEAIKQQIERTVRGTKGVKNVDNQISVVTG